MFFRHLDTSKNSLCFGLTLTELLVTMGVLGIVSSGVIAAISGARDSAREAAATLQLKNIERAIAVLELDTGEWPGGNIPYQAFCQGDGDEFADLTTGTVGLLSNGGSFVGWDGPYMEVITSDPWGNAYFLDYDYEISSGVWGVVLGSYGPNGVGPNLYDSDDVILILASRSDC